MMITILGPTASGKTTLAAHLAHRLNAEIISADSRQVYRGMDIGTGKDLADYQVDGSCVPVHLIDLCEAGEEYNLYRFIRDFTLAIKEITERGKEVILCGGTGMYIEAILRGYNVVSIPENQELRQNLSNMDPAELKSLLLSFGPVHATSDLHSRDRMITAIEKRHYYQENQVASLTKGVPSVVFGLVYPRGLQREKITDRLHQRMAEGMVQEVQALIDSGVDPGQLLAYGLEYKWLTLFLTGKCTYEEMLQSLNVAIHRFAKRQMTWFRRMEKNGIQIHWLDARLPLEEKLNLLLKILNKSSI